MKKALIFGLALAFIGSAGFMSMSTAAEGPESITITDGTDSPMKTALFPHHQHQTRLECGTCHHGVDEAKQQVAYVSGKGMEQKCSTCHHKGADGISLDGVVPGMSPIQRAGHGRCKGCHATATSTKTPPVNLTMCGTCHK